MNPTALITGASRGIGRGIALELARTGHDLIINYVSNEVAAKKTAEDCHSAADAAGHDINIGWHRADVSLAGDRKALIDSAKKRFGRLDLLVNNAGVAPALRADILDATEESFDRLMGINVKGPCFLTKLAARWMIETMNQRRHAGGSRASQRQMSGYQPKIINISSISASTVSINRGDYCISKAAVSMVTALFAVRLAQHGINVYEIRPGIIETDMTADVAAKYTKLINEGLTPIQRWGKPDDVGKAVVAIAQGLFPFSTGQIINVDGGFHLQRL